MRGHDLRVGRVRPPDADAHAVEVRRAELAAQRLEPVVAGQAAAEADADVAEGEVDLVMDRPARGPARRGRSRARGPTDLPASFMNVCGLSRATRGPPGPVRPSASSALNFFFGFGRSQRRPARRRRGSRRCAACSRSGFPGLPSPTTSQSTGVELKSFSFVVAGGLCGLVGGVALGLPLGLFELSALERLAVLADQRGLGLDLFVDRLERRRGDRGDDGLVEVVEQRDALGHRDGGQRQRLVHLHLGDVVLDDVGQVVRERENVDLARLLAEHAALGDAGRVLARRRGRARRWSGSAGSCRRAAGRRGSPRRAPGGSGRP